MTPKWIVPLGILLLLLIAAPLVLFSGKTAHTPAPAQAPPPPQPSPGLPTPDPNAPIITKAQYDAIKNGMTYDQVTDLIGAMETESKSVYNKGVSGYTGPSVMAWHTWKNPDGSFASIGFMSNKVEEKTEENLK